MRMGRRRKEIKFTSLYPRIADWHRKEVTHQRLRSNKQLIIYSLTEEQER